MEEMFRQIAELDEQPAILLMDRGLLDGKAFIPPTLWDSVMKETGLNEQKRRDDNYDAIIHLVTAADGAVQHYDMENEARADNPEQAIIQDLALREAYAGHPAHYIISNERGISFDDKVNNAVDTVMQITGVPGHRTHYKTFLLKKNAKGQYLFDSKVKLNESRYETTLVEASEEYM